VRLAICTFEVYILIYRLFILLQRTLKPLSFATKTQRSLELCQSATIIAGHGLLAFLNWLLNYHAVFYIVIIERLRKNRIKWLRLEKLGQKALIISANLVRMSLIVLKRIRFWLHINSLKSCCIEIDRWNIFLEKLKVLMLISFIAGLISAIEKRKINLCLEDILIKDVLQIEVKKSEKQYKINIWLFTSREGQKLQNKKWTRRRFNEFNIATVYEAVRNWKHRKIKKITKLVIKECLFMIPMSTIGEKVQAKIKMDKIL